MAKFIKVSEFSYSTMIEKFPELVDMLRGCPLDKSTIIIIEDVKVVDECEDKYLVGAPRLEGSYWLPKRSVSRKWPDENGKPLFLVMSLRSAVENGWIK